MRYIRHIKLALIITGLYFVEDLINFVLGRYTDMPAYAYLFLLLLWGVVIFTVSKRMIK